jgi:hypothetical protein
MLIKVVVNDVTLEIEVAWKMRFFNLTTNQPKWASHHCNYVVWAFFQLNG